MAFKASKKRQRKPSERVGKGSPIIPSFALALWYRRQVNSMVELMIEDYKEVINKTLSQKQTQAFFATDSVSSSFINSLARLKKKWTKIFSSFAGKFAKQYVKKVDEAATMATFSSLKTAGLAAPVARYTKNVENILNSSEEFNKTLITNVSADVHEKVFNAVMLSLTSPDPEKQGIVGIENALKSVGTFSKKRIRLISVDQNSKLYCALSDERMAQNGVDEYEWAHSGGGKVPRHSHVHLDGMRFKLDDERLWQVNGVLNLKKGDLGPPGWAIHCRCRKIPII